MVVVVMIVFVGVVVVVVAMGVIQGVPVLILAASPAAVLLLFLPPTGCGYRAVDLFRNQTVS